MKTTKNNIKFNFEDVGLIIFCLYIASLYLAQDVILPSSYNSLFIYLFIGWGIFMALFRKKIKINEMIIWMICFLFFGLITMLYSPQKGILTGQYYYVVVSFALVLILSQIDINRSRLQLVFWTYSLAATVLTIVLILTNKTIDATGRLGNEIFGNANTLALLMMISIICSMYLIVFFCTHKLQILLLTIFIVFDYYTMLLTGGRKFVIIPIVFLYLLLMLKSQKESRFKILKYTSIVAIVIILIYQIIMKVPLFYEVIGKRMEGMTLFFSKTGRLETSAESRRYMIKMGLEGWLSNPIFGYGFDSFKYYNQSISGGFYYAHNNYVELLYDLGIIGFILYYIFYFRIIKNAFENRNMPMYAKALSISIVISFLIYEYGAVNYSSIPMITFLYFAFAAQNCTE